MAALADWVASYERAWASNDAGEIGALFTDDALYLTAPFRDPWRGRQQIVDGWLDRKDEPGTPAHGRRARREFTEWWMLHT
ncbi:MAG TPA: hypothetical protein VNP89_08230 [Gaiellaceae bacterium]|nr:hypothetical protein [Gaiellaceae bacterium]